MAVIGVGVLAAGATAGATYYSNKKQKDATKAASAQAGQAYGRIPDAAKYKPVNINFEQLEAIFRNQDALPAITGLLKNSNKFITDDALRRASKLIPGYRDAMATYGRAGNDLLNGRLPYEDVLGIVSDRNELTNSLGIPGSGINGTLKDLGLSRLDGIKAGGGILKDMVGIAETISPIGRNTTPQSFMLSPQERINYGMQQNQLIQQSQQSANNLAASGDPAAYAQMQLQLAQGGQDAAAIRSYGSAINSGIGASGTAFAQPNQQQAGSISSTSGNFYPANSWQSSYLSANRTGRPVYYNGYVR